MESIEWTYDEVLNLIYEQLDNDQIKKLVNALSDTESKKLFRAGPYWLWVTPGMNNPFWISDLDGDEIVDFPTRNKAVYGMVSEIIEHLTIDEYPDMVYYEINGQLFVSEVVKRFEDNSVLTVSDGMRAANEVSSVYMTNKITSHRLGLHGPTIEIDMGTDVIPATNLPDGGYWIIPPNDFGGNEDIKRHIRVYGLWVPQEDVILRKM